MICKPCVRNGPVEVQRGLRHHVSGKWRERRSRASSVPGPPEVRGNAIRKDCGDERAEDHHGRRRRHVVRACRWSTTWCTPRASPAAASCFTTSTRRAPASAPTSFAAKLNAARGAPIVPRPTDRPGRSARRRRLRAQQRRVRSLPLLAPGLRDPQPPRRPPDQRRERRAGRGVPLAAQHQEHPRHLRRTSRSTAPDAFLINLTNPMSRVTLAINRATKVRNVGMCHEMPLGINRLRRRIRVKREATSRPRRRGSTTSPSSPSSATGAPARTCCPGIRELFARPLLRLLAADRSGWPAASIAACPARTLRRVQLPPPGRPRGPRVRPGALLGRQPHRRVPAVRPRRRRRGCRRRSTSTSRSWRVAEKLASWAATTKVPLPLQAARSQPRGGHPDRRRHVDTTRRPGSWPSTCPTAATCPTSPTAPSSRSAPRSTATASIPTPCRRSANRSPAGSRPRSPSRTSSSIRAHRRPRPGASRP